MVLPAPGWPQHEQVVTARSGDLDGSAGEWLSDHVTEIRYWHCGRLGRIGRRIWPRRAAREH